MARRRTGEAIEEIDKITTKIIATAETVVEEATSVLKNAGHKLWRDGENASCSTKQLVKKLTKQLQVAQRVIDQSKQVVSGNRNIPDRIVSIYDTDARPIKRVNPKNLRSLDTRC